MSLFCGFFNPYSWPSKCSYTQYLQFQRRTISEIPNISMNLWTCYHADIMVPRFFPSYCSLQEWQKTTMFQIMVLGKNTVTTRCQRRHRGTSGHIQTQILVSTEIFLASHRTRYGQIFILFSATTAPRQANGLIPLSTSVNFCGIIPSICFLVLKTKGVLFIFYFF